MTKKLRILILTQKLQKTRFFSKPPHDSRFFEKVKNLSEQERLTIVNDKKINKRELFTNLNLNKITDPQGGASWETIDSVQEND